MRDQSAAAVAGALPAPAARLEPDAIGVAQDTLIGLASTGPSVSIGLTLAALAAVHTALSSGALEAGYPPLEARLAGLGEPVAAAAGAVRTGLVDGHQGSMAAECGQGLIQPTRAHRAGGQSLRAEPGAELVAVTGLLGAGEQHGGFEGTLDRRSTGRNGRPGE